MRRTPIARVAAPALAALVLSAGCGSASAHRPPSGADVRNAATPAVVATAGVAGVDVFSAPQGVRFEHLSGRTDLGSPRVLLVTGERGPWLRVLLPERPNGSQGWVPAGAVTLRRTDLQVVVSLSRHQLRLLDAGRPILRAPVSTGAPGTPTPTGRYYVTDVVRVRASQRWYGPFALGLSGFSPTLTTFAGGDGQLALHGTDQPRLLGRPVSHGCIRLPNAAVTRLASLLPLGAPVTITD